MEAATGEESTETQITLNKNKYISQFHHLKMRVQKCAILIYFFSFSI